MSAWNIARIKIQLQTPCCFQKEASIEIDGQPRTPLLGTLLHCPVEFGPLSCEYKIKGCPKKRSTPLQLLTNELSTVCRARITASSVRGGHQVKYVFVYFTFFRLVPPLSAISRLPFLSFLFIPHFVYFGLFTCAPRFCGPATAAAIPHCHRFCGPV